MKHLKLTKKKCILAACAAGAVLAGLLGFGQLTAQAYGVLTGIEAKVTEKLNAKEEYHILEVIPDGSVGEIGYLVKDCEPVPLQDRMDTYLTENGVSNTKANRAAYLERLQNLLAGFYGSQDTAPLSASDTYEEFYFPDATQKQNLNLLKFSSDNYEYTTLTGQFVKNADGEGTYDENIISFHSNEAGGYYVEFENTAPPSEGDEHYGDSLYTQPYEYKAGGYYQLVTNPKNNMKYAYISSFSYYGSDVISAKYAADIDAQYPYKYVGQNGYYDFVEGNTATDTADSTETSVNASYPMQIGQVYYQGGYTNNEWFKNRIFAADILDKAKDMDIVVTTVTESELKDTDLQEADFVYICGDTTASGKGYQINGSNWSKIQELYAMVWNNSLPCLVDSSLLSDLENGTVRSDIDKLALLLLTKTQPSDTEPDWNTIISGLGGTSFDGIHTNYVSGSVYFMDTEDGTAGRQPCFSDFDVNLDTLYGENTVSEGFSEISAAITSENAVRNGTNLLNTDISKMTAIQYIINDQNKREIVKKDSVKILDIEPAWGSAYHKTGDNQVLTAEKVRTDWGIDADTIQIVPMTTAEFIGKIDDLNTDYDLIYFGLGYADDFMNRDSSGNVIYNDTNMGNLVYAHTGDLVYADKSLAGILDTDYIGNSRSNYLYDNNAALDAANDAYGNRVNAVTNSDGILHLTQTVLNIADFPLSYTSSVKNSTTYYKANQWTSVRVGNVGVYRYGGNDITKSKLADLREYVSAKYPVIVADDFLSGDKVNNALIDNSSYLYEFVNEAKTEDNFYTYSEVAHSASFSNYLNLAKLTVQFYQPEKLTESDEAISKSDDADIAQGNLLTAAANFGNTVVEVDKTSAEATDSYTLRMRFAVGSSVDVSSATRYVFRYYMDLNADGKYTVADSYSEKMSDILIYDENGKEITKSSDGEYELTSGQKYTMEKLIPATYRGVLPWKIEVCQLANEAVRTSSISYTIIEPETGETAQPVTVLQVLSDSGNTFNMKTNTAFQKLLSQIKTSVGLDFHVVTVTASQFDSYFSNGHTISDASAKGYLDQFYSNGSCNGYDMLVIGFGDCYSKLDSDAAMEAVRLFADSGKSVLFTHDTTSFTNVSSYSAWTSLAKSEAGSDGKITMAQDTWWGYKFNTMLRNLVGMDRYGVTDSDLLRQGQILNLTAQKDSTGNLTDTTAVLNEGGFSTRNSDGQGVGTTPVSLGTQKDIAYVAGSARTQSYGETQGYTYGMLDENRADYSSSSRVTNQQFFQYSINRTSTAASQVNDGQITHYPYEIGTELEIAPTHYQYYQLDMDMDSDQDGNSDIVVWYCLDSSSDKISNYTVSPNDVRNNYYIYSIGNIMYTGVGNLPVAGETGATSTDQTELKLFANTLVAAYKATPQKPNVTIIENSDRTSAAKSYAYINIEQSVNSVTQQDGQALDSDLSFYYKVTDSNLATSKKDIRAKYFLVTSDGTEAAQLHVTADTSQAYISTTDESGQNVVNESEGEVSGLVSGHVYQAVLHNIATDTGTLKTLLESGKFQIRVELESAFHYYGTKSSAKTSVDTLTVLKTSLIDLQ